MDDFNSNLGAQGQQNPKYNAEAEYGENYLQSTQDPERYNEMVALHDGVKLGFDDFLDKNREEYGYLRSIDVGLAIKGDEICVAGYSKPGIIKSIKGQMYVITMEGEDIETEFKDIRPVDEYINRLKAVDTCNLYTHIRGMVDIESQSEIDYFFVFSEFFKINEKTLYYALPVEIQGKLMQELNERTGAFAKKGIRSAW